ncbi:MAG TPA: HEAT repeat domain-containing protein [Opitutaceae bacterium]|nr:HEAT repeat domain-containing protein [Opitutaceae bacterium]
MRPSFPVRTALVLAALSVTAGNGLAQTPEVPQPRLKLESYERLPEPEVAPASNDPTESIKHFKLPPGFSIQLFAAEPLLANPVAFAFDEKGTVYVSETYRYRSSVLDIRGYMPMLEQDLASHSLADRSRLLIDQFGEAGVKELSIESEIVRRVVDRDGDGVADGSSVFADKFNHALDGIASGVLARDGKVWFTNIPHLWLLDGPDANGKSTGRTSLSEGYGVRYGYTGHDLHGLIMGPDGKLYFSVGDRGAHVETKEGRTVSAHDMGAVFRSNPDGSELEIVHSGLRNPQELAFDDYGNLFTGDNDSDQGDVERFVYVVEGGDSGWRVGYQHNPLGKAGPWNSEKLWVPAFPGQAAYIVPPIVNIADGPSGLTHYPGVGLPESFRGHFFMCHFKGSYTTSGIFVYQLEEDGAFFKMKKQEPFISGTLPTDVDFGPDGRLYFSDWGQGWSKSKKGRLYALTHTATAGDPLIKETQRLLAEGMSGRPLAELSTLIGHKDQRVRREAQYALAAKGADAIGLLGEVASSSRPQLARIHATWALGQIGRHHSQAMQSVLPLLNDSDRELRAQAAKVLGDTKYSPAYDPLVKALRDPAARVRFFAAQSLGKLARPEATPALLELLRGNADQDLYVRHAAVMGLVGSNNLAALVAAASDSSRSVRMAVVLALRRLARSEISLFLQDKDPLVIVEAARAINDAPIVEAQPALADLLADVTVMKDEAIGLRVLNAHFRIGKPQNALALAAFALRTDAPERLRVEALAHLTAWATPPARDRILGIYRPLSPREAAPAAEALAPQASRLLSDPLPSVVTATVQALEKLKVTSAGDALLALALKSTAAAPARAAALLPLSQWKHPRFADAVKAAGLSNDAGLRAAAQTFYQIFPPAEAVPLLTHALEKGTLVEKQSALLNLVPIQDARVDQILGSYLTRMTKDRALAGLQVEILDAAEKRGTPALKTLLEKRTSALANAPVPEKFSYALVGGNRQQGRKLFTDHPVLACVRCHKVRGEGGDAGPALDTIAKTHSRDYILEGIVAPNATIATGFDSVSLTLKDGSTQMGSIASETATHLTLRPVSGTEPVQVAKADIVKRESAPSSMPDIFSFILTRAELRDLVEYVGSLGAPAPNAPRSKGAGNTRPDN